MKFRRAIRWLTLGCGSGLGAIAADDPAARFEGTWLGTVTAPKATAEIGFAFRRTEKGLFTTFHMPAMGIDRAPVGPAETKGDTLVFAPLATTLTRDGNRLLGTFALSHLP